MIDTVSVYDPDGEERIVTREEAEAMGERGEAIYCNPHLDFGDEMPDHWHHHEPWSDVAARLEYLRGEIEAERISYGEIVELQDLAPHVDPSDTLLLQWAGVPEYPEDRIAAEDAARP